MKALAVNLTLLLAFAGPLAARAGALTPNDPFYATRQWYAPMVGLPAAWDQSTGTSSVIVAVLDTGVISTTPDMAGRILPALSATGVAPFSDATLEGSTILRHGTWVASIAAMQINNGQGGAGIGDFSILPITVTNEAGNNSSDWIAAGIRLAADQGAKVINVSSSTLTYGDLDSAAAYALSKGALTFVAAGNSDARVNMSSFDNLIFVAGTDRADARWSNGGGVGSSWGPYVDLSAPAKDILVADPMLLPNGYGIGDGTSFASPLAAGVAALAWSINPGLSPDDVRSLLFGTAVDLGTPGWDEVFGWGRINAAGVAAGAGTVPEPATLLLLVLAGPVVFCRRTSRRNAAD